jgi:mycobactin peptide synthetase MbtE
MADPEALAWWRQRLADLPPPALQELVRPHRQLPTAPRLSRRVAFTIDASVADGLRHLARATGATPYMVLLAAFRTLLVRLTTQADICIGTLMTKDTGVAARGWLCQSSCCGPGRCPAVVPCPPAG